MDRNVTIALWLLVILLISGCQPIAPPAIYGSPPPPSLSAFNDTNAIAAANARSTETAWIALGAESTRQALSMQATTAAGQATQAANNATAQAVAAITGTAAAQQEAARQTAAAISATTQSLSIQGTAIALAALETRTHDSLAATRQGLENQARLDSALISEEATRVVFARQQQAARQERNDRILSTFLLLLVITAAGFALYFIVRSLPRVVRIDGGPPVVLVPTPTGFRPLAAPARLALPAPAAGLLSERANPHPDQFGGNGQTSIMPFGERASWGEFQRWDDPRFIPIGANQSGLLLVKLEDNPHLLVAGKSGTGKTRFMLWLLTAAALARRAHVIAVNGQGADFLPFARHQNLTMVRGTNETIGGVVTTVMTGLVREADRRLMVLDAAGCSTWDRLPPGTDPAGELLVVIDEFVDLTDPIYLSKKEGDHLMGLFALLARKCRKLGIHFVFVAQSPGERNLGKRGLSVRDQCGRIVFFVEDEAVSRTILNSVMAARLPPKGYVATRIGGSLQSAVTFQPDEDQVVQYLAQRPVPYSPLPVGLEQVCRAAGNGRPNETNAPAPVDSVARLLAIHSEARRIVEMRVAGSSKRAIEQAIFGYQGGEAYEVVTAVLEAYQQIAGQSSVAA